MLLQPCKSGCGAPGSCCARLHETQMQVMLQKGQDLKHPGIVIWAGTLRNTHACGYFVQGTRFRTHKRQ